MNGFEFRAILVAAALALLVGCAKPAADPYSDHFGEAYWANRDATIANPDVVNEEGVVDLDGATADGVMESYRDAQSDQEMGDFEDDDSMIGGGGFLSH